VKATFEFHRKKVDRLIMYDHHITQREIEKKIHISQQHIADSVALFDYWKSCV
jgi:hypothetical protein